MSRLARWVVGSLSLILLAGACSPAPLPTPAPTPLSTADWQATVEAMAALVGSPAVPDHLLQEEAVRRGDEFDPNRYFAVLGHLSMEPGYVLDYVYYYDFWAGLPLLYARPADQSPYQTYAEYALVMGEDMQAERDAYLQRVRTDGSAAGFFELVVLHIMGEQFYQVWHAHYNDDTILTDRESLEALIAGLRDTETGFPLSDESAQQARALDPAPVIEIGADRVRVQVLVFSKWSGFSRETYTFSRNFPHRLLDAQRETLVPYDCGIRF